MDSIQFRAVENGKSGLVAFATVPVADGIALADWAVFDGVDGLEVAPPRRSYVDRNGVTRWVWLIQFANAEIQEAFTGRVRAAYEVWRGTPEGRA